MEIILGIIIAIAGLILVMSLRLITTFFHEMGHAIPALIFTKDKVEVYVGSYGDISKSLKLVIGRLKLFLKWNIFEWQIGLCRSQKILDSTWKRILIVIGGPIASLIISIPLILNLQRLQSNSFVFFISIVFIGAAIFDLAINLYPSASPMNMHDGDIAYSDGYVLRALIARSFLDENYFEMEKKYEAKKYDQVVNLGLVQIENDKPKRYLFEFIISSYINLKEDQKALEMYNQLGQQFKLDASDYFEIGKLHKRLSNYQEAAQFFNECYYFNYQDPMLLNEIGIVQMHLNNHPEAIKYLSRAIAGNPQFTPSYKNRATAYINEASYELAKQDLDIALQAQGEDPELYYLLGLYHEKTQDYAQALKNYNVAKKLNSKQHGLDFKIEMMRNQT